MNSTVFLRRNSNVLRLYTSFNQVAYNNVIDNVIYKIRRVIIFIEIGRRRTVPSREYITIEY